MYLEGLLDEGRFPNKGRSWDDKESHDQWWEDRYGAVRAAQELLAACEQADKQAQRLQAEILVREEEARKRRLAEGVEELRAIFAKRQGA